MKKYLCLIVMTALAIGGCASPILYTNSSRCALQGMQLEGVSMGDSSGQSYNYRTQSTVNTYSSYYGVNCSVPKDAISACYVSARREALEPALEYNNGFEMKRLITGLGYTAFIVPGVIAKFYYDSEAIAAATKSLELRKAAEAKCGRYPASFK